MKRNHTLSDCRLPEAGPLVGGHSLRRLEIVVGNPSVDEVTSPSRSKSSEQRSSFRTLSRIRSKGGYGAANIDLALQVGHTTKRPSLNIRTLSRRSLGSNASLHPQSPHVEVFSKGVQDPNVLLGGEFVLSAKSWGSGDFRDLLESDGKQPSGCSQASRPKKTVQIVCGGQGDEDRARGHHVQAAHYDDREVELQRAPSNGGIQGILPRQPTMLPRRPSIRSSRYQYARTADTMLDEEKTRAEVESRMQARNALKFSTQRQLSTKRRQELQEKKALFADMVERMEAQQKSAVQIQAAFRAYKARQEYLKEKKLKSLWEAVNAMDEKAKREQLAEEERLNRIKMNELAKQQKASDNKLSRPKTSHEYQVGRKQQFDSLSPPASRHLDRRFQDGRLNCDQACAGDDSKSARAKPPFMGNGHRVRFGKDALDTCYGLSASSARIASRLDSPVLIPCTNRDKGSSTRGEMNSPNQRELSAFEEYLHKGPENDSTNVGSLKPSIKVDGGGQGARHKPVDHGCQEAPRPATAPPRTQETTETSFSQYLYISKLYIPDEVLEHLRPKSPQVPRTSSPPRTHLIPRPKTSGPSMTPTKAGFRLPAPLDVKNPMHGVLRLKNESPPERKSSPPQESSEKTALKSKNVGSAVVSKNVGSAVVNIPSGPGFPLHEYQSETVNDAVLRLGKESKHSRDKGDTANQLDLLLEKKNEKAAQPLKARYLMLERSV